MDRTSSGCWLLVLYVRVELATVPSPPAVLSKYMLSCPVLSLVAWLVNCRRQSAAESGHSKETIAKDS